MLAWAKEATRRGENSCNLQRKRLTQRAAATVFGVERPTLPRHAEDDHTVVTMA